ncbi:MAG: hypothetical protein SPJ71_08035 [Candidatus Limisoma sp.]|nr:hypothetical protein [Bacteroidales bacterium]MDY5894496.1 hypothetical protein [Candidatus Limisoma sp.]MDY5899843.1 hypothetical protein [Candidatus Limisoma sp.]
MKLQKLLTYTIAALAIASCSDSDTPDADIYANYVCYNAVTNRSTEESILSAGNYRIQTTFGNEDNTLTLSGSVIIKTGDDPIHFTTDPITMKFDGNAYTFSNGVATSDNGKHTITDLSGKLMLVNNIIIPRITYTVDDTYHVAATSNSPIFYCPATTTTPQGQDPYAYTGSLVTVKFADSKTADITIVNAKFSEAMPAMTMTVPNVTLTPIEGGYEFTTDRIVPELNGTPFEQYAFTNFNFRVDTDGTVMRCNFVCTFKGIPHQIATYGSTFPPIE